MLRARRLFLYFLWPILIVIFIFHCDNPAGEEEKKWPGPLPWKVYEIKELRKNENINGVHMISVNDGWACASPEILKFDGNRWFIYKDFTSSFKAKFWGMHFSAPDDGWAVGYKRIPGEYPGVVVHYDGNDWKEFTPTPGESILYCVFALAPDDVWVGGDTGIFHYDGSSWTPWPVATFVTALHFTTPTHGWAVTDHPSYLRWDGSCWTGVSSLFDYEYRYDVFAPTPTTGWAVGGGALGEIPPEYPIFRYVAERDTWEPWEQDDWSRKYPPKLYAVHFAAPDDGWAAGQGVYHFDGKTWNHIPVPEGCCVYDVFTLGGDDVWLAGFDRKMYKYAPEMMEAVR